MKKIPLSIHRTNKLKQDTFALVDDEDYEFIKQFNWSHAMDESGNTAYARRKVTCVIKQKRINIHMHRVIMKVKPGQYIDHIDGNGLNNQKYNLRICSQEQNSQNKKTNKHKKLKAIKGVTIVRDRRGVPSYWIARITINSERKYLGTFKTKEMAEDAYKHEAIKHHGVFARW